MTELDPKMRVGLRIKELRGELGMSQEAFAYSIEMSRTYFAEVETGKRTCLSRISSASQAGLASL